MDDGGLAILGFVLIFVVLDLLALRFGYDSRRLQRELPLPGDPVVRLPRVTGHQVRSVPAAARFPRHALPVPPVPTGPAVPFAHLQRRSRPFRPDCAGDAHGYPRFDLAAIGK
jgi:hypothetical protein